MRTLVHAVDRPDLAPLEMPGRFAHDVTYFMTPPGEPGVPPLAKSEYWVRLDDARRWVAEGVFEVVSPLDSASKAEVEITEEQEAWLEWMVAEGVERIRVEKE